jgi:hypothetical protein
MTTVYWSPYFEDEIGNAGAAILWEQPIPFIPEMRRVYGDSVFMTCPAITNYYKNAFIIKAPKDLTITMMRDLNNNPLIRVNEFTQEQCDTLCLVRSDASVTIMPTYLFYADESVLMESLPLTVLPSPSVKNIMWISGVFDIGKWMRPIDCSFLVQDERQPVIIKRGDPLWIVRYTPEDDSKVILERVSITPQALSAMRACVGVTKHVNKVPLKRLYELADGYLKALGFKRKDRKKNK